MTSRNWKSLADNLPPRRNATAQNTNDENENTPLSLNISVNRVTKLVIATLRVGDAAVCMDCLGVGHTSYGPCRRCNGKGATCPKCRGMRFVRRRQRGYQPWEAEVIRCPACTEGNNVNEMAEVKAIKAYIALADGDTRS